MNATRARGLVLLLAVGCAPGGAADDGLGETGTTTSGTGTSDALDTTSLGGSGIADEAGTDTEAGSDEEDDEDDEDDGGYEEDDGGDGCSFTCPDPPPTGPARGRMRPRDPELSRRREVHAVGQRRGCGLERGTVLADRGQPGGS